MIKEYCNMNCFEIPVTEKQQLSQKSRCQRRHCRQTGPFDSAKDKQGEGEGATSIRNRPPGTSSTIS